MKTNSVLSVLLLNEALNPNLKKTIECVKIIVKGKEGMGA